VIRLLAATLAAALLAVGTAAASEERPTLAELENEVVCPTCHTTLALSTSPIAARMRAFIRGRILAGDTKSDIKAKLVKRDTTALAGMYVGQLNGVGPAAMVDDLVDDSGQRATVRYGRPEDLQISAK
jgi:hypothetical protein